MTTTTVFCPKTVISDDNWLCNDHALPLLRNFAPMFYGFTPGPEETAAEVIAQIEAVRVTQGSSEEFYASQEGICADCRDGFRVLSEDEL